MDNLERVLKEYAELIEQKYRERLEASRASGKLIDSVRVSVTSNGSNYTINIELLDYWYWVENGRQPGKFPPTDKIVQWISDKGIIPQPYQLPNGKQHNTTVEQLAYLIGRKIATDGTEGKHYLEDTINEINDGLLAAIKEAVIIDFKNEILGNV